RRPRPAVRGRALAAVRLRHRLRHDGAAPGLDPEPRARPLRELRRRRRDYGHPEPATPEHLGCGRLLCARGALRRQPAPGRGLSRRGPDLDRGDRGALPGGVSRRSPAPPEGEVSMPRHGWPHAPTALATALIGLLVPAARLAAEQAMPATEIPVCTTELYKK